MNSLVLLVGNWILVAVFGICLLLIIRLYFRSYYNRLFHSIEFKPLWITLAAIMIGVIMWREILVVPFYVVQSWLPGSSIVTQFIFWLYTTHLVSILLVGGFIFLMWRKFQSLLPAVFVGWLALGVIEFSFVPQHLIMIHAFVGANWYTPFFGLMVPLFLDRSNFGFNRKGLVFILGAVCFQYGLIFLYPWSLSIFNSTYGTFGINYSLFPEPPLISWIFMELNHVIKILYLAAFSYFTFTEKNKNE